MPPASRRLHVEELEQIVVPSTVTWTGGSGDWDTAANWTDQSTFTNHVPTAADDAVISGTLSVSFSNPSATVHSLSISGSATFDMEGGTVSAGTFIQADTGGVISGTGTLTAPNVLLGTGGGQLRPFDGTGPGTLTINGNFSMNSEGVIDVRAGGAGAGQYDRINISGSAALDGTLDISGTYAPAAGDVFPFVTFGTHSGTFQTVNNTLDAGANSFATVTTGTSVRLIDVPAGTTKYWTGSGDGVTWSSAANWSGGTLPGATDDVFIDASGTGPVTSNGTVSVRSIISNRALAVTGGNFTVAQPSTFNGGLTLSNGTLTANGAVTLNGTSTWSGGGFAGTASVTNAGALSVTAAVSLGSTPLINSGTVTQSASVALASASITNLSGGLYVLNGAVGFTSISGTHTFTNAGTLRKSAAGGTSALPSVMNFNNQGGTVDVLAGTLTLSRGTSTGGTYTVAGGAVLNLTGGGTQTWTGTHTGTGAGTINLDGGGANTGQINSGAGGFTMSFPAGLFRWKTGATLGGATNAGAITIDAAGGSVTLGGTFTNTGTVTQVAGNVNLSSATISNQGLYDLAGDVGFGTIAGTHTFNNAGTLRKSAGAGSSSLPSVMTFNNQGGTIDVQAGTLSLRGGTSTGGTYTVASGAVLNLTGGGTQTWTGTHTGTGAGVINLDAGGANTGTLVGGAGGATLNFASGLFKFAIGSTLAGTVTNAGYLTLNANGTVTLAAALTNTGTITHTLGNFNLNGATLTNTGLYDLTGDGGFGTVSPTNAIINTGTFQKSGGTGTSTIPSANSTTFANTARCP